MKRAAIKASLIRSRFAGQSVSDSLTVRAVRYKAAIRLTFVCAFYRQLGCSTIGFLPT